MKKAYSVTVKFSGSKKESSWLSFFSDSEDIIRERMELKGKAEGFTLVGIEYTGIYFDENNNTWVYSNGSVEISDTIVDRLVDTVNRKLLS